MPFVFAIIGAVLLIAGIRGGSAAANEAHPSETLVSLVHDDLIGPQNFIYWIVSILLIGALGYIDGVKNFSRALMVLVLIVLVLAEEKKSGHGGFFTEFRQGINQISGGAA
jgi:type IV secretory pathway VirB2 component (pilin)